MHATATASARNKFVTDGVGSTPPERLLVMLYDRLLRDLDDAVVAISRADVGGAHAALTHAQDIVVELHSALDTDAWEGAGAMADLYTWLGELLARANVKKSSALVDEARSLVQPMRDTWDEAHQALVAATGAVAAGVGAGPSGSGGPGAGPGGSGSNPFGSGGSGAGSGGPGAGGLDVSG